MDSRRHYVQLESRINDATVSQLAQQDKVPWYRKPNLRVLYLLMLPACVGVDMTTGFDSSMVNGLQAVPSWLEYFHHPRSTLLGFMVAVYALGSAIAVPFVPVVVDKFGRRSPIFLGGITSMIGGTMQGFSVDATMFITGRFILGFAGPFSLVAASSLIGELSHPNERAFMGCLFGAFFNLGAVVAAGLTFGTFAMTSNWGWRIPSCFQAVLSLAQVSFIWFLPESPRWLISKGRQNEAHDILVKYHAEGDDDSEFVKAEYAQIEQTLKAEQKFAQANWKELFSTPGMRKRVIIAMFLGVFINWSGIGLMSHYLASVLDSIGIHDNRTKNIINLARGSLSFFSSTVSAFIAPRYPRRKMFLASVTSLFIIFVSWTAASAGYSITHSKVSAQAVLALIFLFSVTFNMGYTIIIYVFLVELFPFRVRAKGISISHWCDRVAGFISQAINPIGISVAGWKWYLVYCVWNAFSVAFVYFMIPETSGRTLEELAFLFEGDEEGFRRGEVETLCERRDAETYGTMEDPRRSGR